MAQLVSRCFVDERQLGVQQGASRVFCVGSLDTKGDIFICSILSYDWQDLGF